MYSSSSSAGEISVDKLRFSYVSSSSKCRHWHFFPTSLTMTIVLYESPRTVLKINTLLFSDGSLYETSCISGDSEGCKILCFSKRAMNTSDKQDQ